MENKLSSTENKILMAQAREALQGKWGNAIGVIIVYILITFGLCWIPKVGEALQFFMEGVLALGLAGYTLALARHKEARLSQLFIDINRSMLSFAAYFMTSLFIILWALLLIIPGLIAAYAFSMTFYIMADDDSIGPLEAITKSKQMMQGNKWKLFCLQFRFIGWALLCVLTAGIGFLWLIPYIMVSNAQFYDDIKQGQADQSEKLIPD
jgi:uncharacterized membrane protein